MTGDTAPSGSNRPRTAPLPPASPPESWIDHAAAGESSGTLPPYFPDRPADAPRALESPGRRGPGAGPDDENAFPVETFFEQGEPDPHSGDDEPSPEPGRGDHRIPDIADRLERAAQILRREGIAGITGPGSRFDRFETMLAGVIAGYLAAEP